MKKSRTILLILVITGSVVAGYAVGRDLLFADQWPVFDGLRQTAAIVFGLSGAYIAIVYPAALTSLLRQHKLESDEARAFRSLLTSMELSFAILLAVLVAGFLAPVVRHNGFFNRHVKVVCGISFAFASILVWVEIGAIVSILYPLDSFTRDIERQQRSRDIVKGLSNAPLDEGHGEEPPAQ